MAAAILDSYAVLAFLFKEPGWRKVSALLEAASEKDSGLLVAAPNWAEICYMVERKLAPDAYRPFRLSLLSLPLTVVAVDQELAESAARFKNQYRMSLADCFAAALAVRENAVLYTGDPEFKPAEKELKIIWL
jgi:predicted nucleic acid-binding protein